MPLVKLGRRRDCAVLVHLAGYRRSPAPRSSTAPNPIEYDQNLRGVHVHKISFSTLQLVLQAIGQGNSRSVGLFLRKPRSDTKSSFPQLRSSSYAAIAANSICKAAGAYSRHIYGTFLGALAGLRTLQSAPTFYSKGCIERLKNNKHGLQLVTRQSLHL
ncbi:unnamed protein product [Periconia digitata]|uniref:Uncharacterized protein n=1 Tax=Periconia digitata TaxID=1303443 RepID=A0A9W4UP83_9PLEO|nr:unnamed protein product [Periconia digitata]